MDNKTNTIGVKKILVVVDYQKDFINGVLPVPGAKSISQNIQKEIDSGDYSHIIYTFDTHTESEYKTSEEKELFPDIHCEFKTKGWELYKIKPISNKIFKSVVKKMTKPFEVLRIEDESFFCKNKFDIFEGNNLYEDYITKSFGISTYEMVIVGVATEFCVNSHVIGLRQIGYNVSVKEDCISAIDNEAGKATINSFKDNGVRIEGENNE